MEHFFGIYLLLPPRYIGFRDNTRMKMKTLIPIAICCCILFYPVLSLKSITKDDSKHTTLTYEESQQFQRPFGSRITATRTTELNNNQRQNSSLNLQFIYPKQQLNSNWENKTKEISKWLYLTLLNFEKPSVDKNNEFNNSKNILEKNLTKLENAFLEKQSTSKSNCMLSSDGNREVCLRNSKSQKLSPESADHRKNNLLSNISNKRSNSTSDFSKRIGNIETESSYMNNGEITDHVKTVQTTGANNQNNLQEESQNPCTCYWTSDSCGCDCIGSLNYDNFQELSRGFFPCRNFTFKMTGGHHYALPPNFFTNVKRVESFRLFISNSSFEYICDPTPMTSPFKDVMFAKSAIIRLMTVSVRRGWNWKPFEELQSSSGGQVKIILEDCKLRRLTSDFSNLAKGQVDTLRISNSNLEMVGSNAFGTFENMTHFRVPSNKIKDLRRSDFPQLLPKLSKMDLRNNQLRDLDKDLFENMPLLKDIYLSGNPLFVLSEKTFQNIIGHVNLPGLSEIPLNCDCNLRWLKDSKMSANAVMKRNMNGAVCKRPSYLRGIPLEYLSKEHLICV